jgi:pyruvate-formate lyase-activating enzyme
MARVQLVEPVSDGDTGFRLGSSSHPLLEPCEPLEGWGLSTYTRCAFRCRYCITGVQGASAPRVGADRLLAQLEAELTFHQADHIGVGLFCDAYPPIEQDLGLTRLALQVLVERGLDIRVITKGLTVWRDVDLLADRPHVGVNISLCSTQEELLRPFDGSAPPPQERLDLLHRLADAGVSVELALSPWIPGVTDTAALIDAVDPAIPIRITPLRVRAPKVIDTAFGRAWDQEEINAAFEREFLEVGERRNVFWSPGAPLDGSAPHITLLVTRPGREERVGPKATGGGGCACP